MHRPTAEGEAPHRPMETERATRLFTAGSQPTTTPTCAQALKSRDADRSVALLAAIDALEKSFSDRILPIDAPVVAEWTRLLAGNNKDRWDLALAAQHGFMGSSL